MRYLVAVGLLLVMIPIFLTISGGGEIASQTEPDPGGCVVEARSSSPAVGSGTRSSQQKSAQLTAEQMAAARTITAVGKGLGIVERGVAIALATAMQESTLDPNATAGRATGLFQQQGQLYQSVNRTDPAAASGAFYQQLLQRVPEYADPASGTLADIAQEVQRSGAGAIKYAEWEAWAIALARELVNGPPASENTSTSTRLDDSVVCAEGGGSGPIPVHARGTNVAIPRESGIVGTLTFPNPAAATAAAAALSYLGTPYAWGGGDPNGPTRGQRDGGVADDHKDYTKVGFDCSGLTEYAWAQAGMSIGGDSRAQRAIGGAVHSYGDALPGDLLFYGLGAQFRIHHVALYVGAINGTAYMIEAPSSGDMVKLSPVRTGGDFRHETVRPWE